MNISPERPRLSPTSRGTPVLLAHVAIFGHFLPVFTLRYQPPMRTVFMDCVISIYCRVIPPLMLEFTLPSHVLVPQECYLPQFLVELVEYFQFYLRYIYRECTKCVWASFSDLR